MSSGETLVIRSLLTLAVGCFMCQLCWSSPDICVDPGHGGNDSGNDKKIAIPGYFEKDVNLSVADTLCKIIETGAYYSYIRTRASDTTVPRTVRAQLANDSNVAVFISIHHNADTFHTSTQYSLVLYSSTPVTEDTEEPRDTSSLLARKLGFRIRDGFGYPLQSESPWQTSNS